MSRWRAAAVFLALSLGLVWPESPDAGELRAAPPGRPSRLAQAAAAEGQTHLREIFTPAYLIHTDMPEDQLQLILPRLQRMAQEYERRTSHLSSQGDDRRLPFYLFAHREDYQKAGGPADSSGFFDGDRLLACTGPRADARSWHVIQHEAFHQYLIRRLGFGMPIWVQEGMAEYFGESLYTGDGFVSGVVPKWRLERVREGIEKGTFITLASLIAMSHKDWNRDLQGAHYDQAWATVQFLAHGAEGRYQEGLLQYLQDTAKGIDPIKSFRQRIGEPEQIERQWQQYMQEYPKPVQARTYGEVAAQTVASFVARSFLAGQKISTVEQLQALARQDQLQQPKTDRLARELLLEYLPLVENLGEWRIDLAPRAPANVLLTLPDGTQIGARWSLRANRVQGMQSWVQEPNPRGQQR